MNDANEKLIARVRQLLAMAADTSSPEEASIAAGRARKLMDQHQITLADLKESNGFGFARAGKSYRFMPKWKDVLCVAVATFNDCKASFQHEWQAVNKSYSKHVLFQGFEVDVACAVAMYEYLCDAIDRLCKDYIATLGYDRYPAVIGDAYKKACSLEVCTRLRQMQNQRKTELLHNSVPGSSLVLFKMAEVEAEFGPMQTKKVTLATNKRSGRDTEIYYATKQGREDGKNLPINRQIGE